MRSNVPNPPYTPGWAPATYPKPKRRTWPIVAGVLAVVLGLIFLGLCAFGGLVAHDAGKPTSGFTTNPVAIDPPASTGGVRKAPATLNQGDHVDVRAGTYTTTAPADGMGGTWQRVKRMDHELSSVIAGDIVAPGATGIMVVKSTDAGVELAGDCVWRRK